MSRKMQDRSKYKPHQSDKECDRRIRQIRAWVFEDLGCKLGPTSRGGMK
jgi:hypothetical protein